MWLYTENHVLTHILNVSLEVNNDTSLHFTSLSFLKLAGPWRKFHGGCILQYMEALCKGLLNCIATLYTLPSQHRVCLHNSILTNLKK